MCPELFVYISIVETRLKPSNHSDQHLEDYIHSTVV